MKPVMEELHNARQERANVLAVEPSDIVTDSVLARVSEVEAKV